MSLLVLSLAPMFSWLCFLFWERKWICKKSHVTFSSKPMLRCRSRRKRAAVIRIYIQVVKLSEVFFTGGSTWFSIKFTSEFYTFVTLYVPGRIFLLFCQGGAIRTEVSPDINIFVHLAGFPSTKNVMTCQLSACVVRILQTIRRKVTSCSQMRGVISKILHLW